MRQLRCAGAALSAPMHPLIFLINFALLAASAAAQCCTTPTAAPNSLIAPSATPACVSSPDLYCCKQVCAFRHFLTC